MEIVFVLDNFVERVLFHQKYRTEIIAIAHKITNVLSEKLKESGYLVRIECISPANYNFGKTFVYWSDVGEKQKMNSEENKILKIKIGSHLYGTNVETSDEDFSGVFFPSIEYVFGFKSIEEQDLSETSKGKNGKNTKDALDYKLYEYRKFLRLGLENNPNIIEQFFVNKENIIYMDDYGKDLLGMKYILLNKGIKNKFLGYAFSQRHKMQIKADNLDGIENAIELLGKSEPTRIFLDYYLMGEIKEDGGPFKIQKDGNGNIRFVRIGDLNFDVTSTIKKILEKLNNRLDNFTHRKELISKYGYDVKFGMHLIRLMLEGRELLLTGGLKFPLIYANVLLDIRNGKWKEKDIIKYSEELEAEFNNIMENSELPTKPRFEEVEKFTIEQMKKFFKERGYI